MEASTSESPEPKGYFPLTHWSLVGKAGGEADASARRDAIVAPGAFTRRHAPHSLMEEARYPIGAASAVAAAPTGRMVAVAALGAGAQPGALVFVDAASGSELGRHAVSEPVERIAWCPDGRSLLYGNNRATFAIDVDPQSGVCKALWELNDRFGSAATASFSADGARVALRGIFPTVVVHQVSNGQRVAELSHLGAVTSAFLSPNGAQLLTTDGNQAAGVHLWDVASGREIQRFKTSIRGPAYGQGNNDQITISHTRAGKLRVDVNGETKKFNDSDVTRITVRAGVGDDLVTIGDDVFQPASLYGGDGNDRLKAGGGDTQLFGRDGQDIMIGGAGNDSFSGGRGEDLVTYAGLEESDDLWQ